MIKSHKDFYLDPDLYDTILHESSDGEEEYYKSAAAAVDSVLFLGTGSGRLFRHVFEVNPNTIGVESSEEMIKKCKNVVPDAPVLLLDARQIKLDQRFELVIAPYEFFNHFEKDELEKMLLNLTSHLKAGGKIICELKNPYDCVNKSHTTELDFVEVKEGRLEKGYVSFFEDEQKYQDIIEITDLQTGKVTIVTMDWNYYFEREIKAFAQKAGLKITRSNGNFLGKRFTKDSNILLLTLVKT